MIIFLDLFPIATLIILHVNIQKKISKSSKIRSWKSTQKKIQKIFHEKVHRKVHKFVHDKFHKNLQKFVHEKVHKKVHKFVHAKFHKKVQKLFMKKFKNLFMKKIILPKLLQQIALTFLVLATGSGVICFDASDFSLASLSCFCARLSKIVPLLGDLLVLPMGGEAKLPGESLFEVVPIVHFVWSFVTTKLIDGVRYSSTLAPRNVKCFNKSR